jgi:hypothetical protein
MATSIAEFGSGTGTLTDILKSSVIANLRHFLMFLPLRDRWVWANASACNTSQIIAPARQTTPTTRFERRQTSSLLAMVWALEQARCPVSSEAAIVFFHALPTIDVVMPPLAMTASRGNPAQLVFPKDRDRFALRVVIDAGGMHQRRLAEPRRFFDGFNQPAALSGMNELPRLGHLARCGQSTIGCR